MTGNYIDDMIGKVHTLEECLEKGSKDDFPKLTKEGDSYWKRYSDLKGEFKDYSVEMGALLKSVETWIQNTKEKVGQINKNRNQKEMS